MYAIIRIRGNVDMNPKALYALKTLKLTKSNHLSLARESAQSRKTIERVASYLTYGEIDNETLKKLVKKRGRLGGDKRVTEDAIKKTAAHSIDVVIDEIMKTARPEEFGIKPVFRLSPPSTGFERGGIKKTFREGGALGYRGSAINKLILKMI